jgi:hypothetical protein
MKTIDINALKTTLSNNLCIFLQLQMYVKFSNASAQAIQTEGDAPFSSQFYRG